MGEGHRVTGTQLVHKLSACGGGAQSTSCPQPVVSS